MAKKKAEEKLIYEVIPQPNNTPTYKRLTPDQLDFYYQQVALIRKRSLPAVVEEHFPSFMVNALSNSQLPTVIPHPDGYSYVPLATVIGVSLAGETQLEVSFLGSGAYRVLLSVYAPPGSNRESVCVMRRSPLPVIAGILRARIRKKLRTHQEAVADYTALSCWITPKSEEPKEPVVRHTSRFGEI